MGTPGRRSLWSGLALAIVVTIIVAAAFRLFGAPWEARRRAAATAAVERLGGKIQYISFNDPLHLRFPSITCSIDLSGCPIDDSDLSVLTEAFIGTGVDHYSLDVTKTEVTEAGWRAFMKRFGSVRVIANNPNLYRIQPFLRGSADQETR